MNTGFQTREGVEFRHANESDLDGINSISNHYITTTHFTFDLEPYSTAKREQWYSAFAQTGRYQLFVAIEDGGVLGYAHSGPFRPKAAYETSVETTVYLAPDAQRAGIGTRLYELLLDALRVEDVHRAYAGLALPNPESVALHERFGFRAVGTYREVGRKFGRYWDVCWYELGLSDHEVEPAAGRSTAQ